MNYKNIFILTIIFLILSFSQTYELSNRLFKNFNFNQNTIDSNGKVLPFGNIVHTIIFFIVIIIICIMNPSFSLIEEDDVDYNNNNYDNFYGNGIHLNSRNRKMKKNTNYL
jgi:hypothetical protein